MRALIVSDTHRENDNYMRVLERVGEIDLMIHCGDVEGSEYLLEEMAGCNCIFVMGNNDYFSDLPREQEITIENKRIWITHGHNYGVSMGYEIIAAEAHARKMDVVMYGHSHRPCVDKMFGVTVVNPGSLTYPRQEGHRPSYIIMETDGNGKLDFEIKYL